MEPILTPLIFDALHALRNDLPRAAQLLRTPESPEFSDWKNTLDRKLLPRMRPDFPLTAAICGGGSSGKSTLFNTLAGRTLSPTGGTAGINRRVLVALHHAHLHQSNFLEALYEPFGCRPRELTAMHELTQSGDPLYVLSDQIPDNLVLLDTPDFDTGAKGVYNNRQLAQNSLETADILIYIFTNSNYNNRDNTDFLARLIAGIGRRKCFLIYRVYPSFTEKEVLAHAATVAANIYGDNADDAILGIYRADDENAVAAGDKFMTLTPVGKQKQPLIAALARIDPRRQRVELFTSILADVIVGARKILARMDHSARGLAVYLDAIQAAQSHCVREALSHFPMDQAIKRFAEIWLKTDPGYIKAMRKTGKIVELPLTAILATIKWFKQTEEKTATESRNFSSQLEVDLLGAANQLYKSLVDPELEVTLIKNDPVARRMQAGLDQLKQAFSEDGNWGGYEMARDGSGLVRFTIAAHAAAAENQADLKARNWREVLDRIVSHKESILSFSKPMDNELRALADQFRSRMKFSARVQQTFAAFLNILPATAAVTYILATGDPVGGSGIHVKLTGLFGLKDLYALVAIPVTAGIKQADLSRLETMLAPITQTWLNTKLKTVQDLFEEEISAELIKDTTERLNETQALTARINSHIAALEGVINRQG